MQRCGSSSWSRRTAMRGSSGGITTRHSYAARPRGRRGLGEMDVDNAPVPVLLAEYHRRARDVLVTVPARTNRRLLPDPIRAGAAMAPDHRQLIRDDPADVERRPIAARDVLLIELPEPR